MRMITEEEEAREVHRQQILCAAAPELLAVLQEILSTYDPWEPLSRNLLGRIKGVIQKAGGEVPHVL